MKHRIYHSNNVRQRLGEYAARLGVAEPALQAAYDWCIANNVIFESQGKGPDDVVVHIACLDLRKRIPDPVARQLFVALCDEVPGRKLPDYGKNWPTLVDRMRRVWEQLYNIFINKIPSHTIRVNWLRLGGAKIGKGSSVWRNTEVIGVESLTIGERRHRHLRRPPDGDVLLAGGPGRGAGADQRPGVREQDLPRLLPGAPAPDGERVSGRPG